MSHGFFALFCFVFYLLPLLLEGEQADTEKKKLIIATTKREN
jgi:hypothetical protein